MTTMQNDVTSHTFCGHLHKVSTAMILIFADKIYKHSFPFSTSSCYKRKQFFSNSSPHFLNLLKKEMYGSQSGELTFRSGMGLNQFKPLPRQ